MTTKNKTTHTPGPWKRSSEASGCYVESSDGRKVAGVFTDIKHKNIRTTFSEAEANADLIAAAPDLLTALKKAENRIAAWQALMSRSEQEQCGSATELREIRAAIAAAESK